MSDESWLEEDTDFEKPLRPKPGENRLVRTAEEKSYPTEPHSCFYCEEIDIGGYHVEGGEPMITATGRHLYAFNYSDVVPPLGSQHVVTGVNDRWVFRA